jgi:DNA-binding transcriptional ArsR family regulator
MYGAPRGRASKEGIATGRFYIGPTGSPAIASIGVEAFPPNDRASRDYIQNMTTGPLIAEIAGLVGEPARATMLAALVDGRALTASELAFAARVTPQTASTHLAKLTEAGLIAPSKNGRHRYFRLASPKVVEMLDGIVTVARKAAAIPASVASGSGAQRGPNLLRSSCRQSQRRSRRLLHRAPIHRDGRGGGRNH